MAKFSFLTPTNIFTRYQHSKKYTDGLTEPFPEFQRIARNRPFEGIDPAYPKTTDGTSASIVQKTPKRVVQQLPTGVIESENGMDWLALIAQFIYTDRIIPYANEEYGLFEKSHLVIEGGLTFGSACSYAPFINHDGYFCPDLTLPYWGDIFIQKGKRSGYASSYIFMRSWWQKEDIEELIETENELSQSKDYEPTWDTKALKEVLDSESSKDRQATTPDEKERGLNTTAIELVTGFQKGLGAKFYTFNPASDTIVRTKVNKDPRGKMPIDWFYGDIDGNNPLGRGIIELIGGLQNLIDSDMQMYQYNRALMLAPPVIKYGSMGDFSFTPNAVIETDDPNAKVVPLVIDTTAVENYPALYGLQKSQLLNLVNSPDTSISSDVGNPSFSKTDAGVKSQQATISVDDNAIRKRFESWFANWSETTINLYFAGRTGFEELKLDDQTADQLRELARKGEFDLELLNENNEVLINYDADIPILKFRVDASTSKMKDDAQSTQNLISLLETLEQNPLLQQVVPPEKIVGIWNSIVANSAVENPEDLSIDIDQFKEKQEQAQAQQTQQEQPQEQPKGPSESLSFKDVAAIAPKAAAVMLQQAGLPGDELLQPQAPVMQNAPTPTTPTNPLDAQLAQQLSQLGLSQGVISQAIDMLDKGATHQQVLQAIGVKNG